MLYGCYIHLRRLRTIWIVQLCCVFKEDNLHVLGWSSVWFVKNFNIGMFSDTINKIDVKLWMMGLHIQLYHFITLLVTLTLFQGHSSVKQFLQKMLCSYSIKLKLCRIKKYIKKVMKIPLFFFFNFCTYLRKFFDVFLDLT